MPTHYQGGDTEKLALDTLIKLTRSVNAVEARMSHAGTMGDLTPSQFGILESLYHLGDLTQHELGQKLLKSGGNITLVIDNLEKRGLVERRRCKKDRRLIYVTLTEAGKQLIAEVFPRHLQTIIEVLSVLDPEEQAQLGRLCRKLGKPQAEEAELLINPLSN